MPQVVIGNRRNWVTRILLDRNENHFGPAPACLELMRQVDVEWLYGYSRDFEQGRYSPLSTALASRHGLNEDEVLLGYGCEDLLKEAVHFHLGSRGTMLIPSASWWFYRVVASEVQGTTVEYPVYRDGDQYRCDLDELIALTRRTAPRLVLIASPNNPTGSSIGRSDLERFLTEFATLPVVLDQAYHGFLDEDEGPDPFAQLVRRFPNLLVLRTFSKLHALAGARIGYAFTGARHGGLRRFQTRHLGFNRLSERLALAALDSGDYYAAVRRRFSVERERVRDFFSRQPDVTCFRSDANFLLVEMPPGAACEAHRALAESGLVVKRFDEPAFRDCLRISLGTEAENSALLHAWTEAMPLARAATAR